MEFTDFELGQLYTILGPTGLAKLSPTLRKKIQGEFKAVEQVRPKIYSLAADEPEEELILPSGRTPLPEDLL